MVLEKEKVQEKLLFRLEQNVSRKEELDPAVETSESQDVFEFEILPPLDDGSGGIRAQINEGLAEVNGRLDSVYAREAQLNSEIDSLTNHADGLDYIVAAGSGILCGLVDVFFVGEFSLEGASNWGKEKVDGFVQKIAKQQGYKGDSLQGATKFLEEKFPIAADKATSAFGGGLQHHLRDFSHHPTVIGLLFSLLTQFTGMVYGTNTQGVFQAVPLAQEDGFLIGKNLPEKLMFGIVHWFFHLVSDMAGSSTSMAAGSIGTGLPGPLLSLLKELSALPIFKKTDANGNKAFSVWLSKMFNGTLPGMKDANGVPIKFDLRTEIGIVHGLGKQAMPVILNECIVRGFYFIRRMCQELKEKNIRSMDDLKEIEWRKTLPFKNRTIVRMLTIATGTFMAVDAADAVIRAGGINPAILLRINYVGVGRFVVAIGSDLRMGFQKRSKEKELLRLRGEQLMLLDAKLFYQMGNMWLAAQNTQKAMEEAEQAAESAVREAMDTWDLMLRTSESRTESIEKIRKNNQDFADELAELVEWG